jgi:hypothetical protein
VHILPSQLASRRPSAREARFDELDRNWQPVRIRDDPNILAVYTDWSPKEFFVQVLNKSEEPLTQLALAVNVNGAGFAIPKEIEFPQSLPPGETCDLVIPFCFKPELVSPGRSAFELDFALRTSLGLCFFRACVNTRQILDPLRPMARRRFLDLFRGLTSQLRFELHDVRLAPRDELHRRNLFVVAQKDNEVCLAFQFDEKEFICDLEIERNVIRGIVKGDELLFPVIRDSATWTFCSE